jgi:hypothetical protein
MAYLLRKLADKDAWAEVVDSILWKQGDCPPDALVQVFDNRSGVSTWRVATEEEVERVIAAQAFMRSSIGDFAYCLIDEQTIKDEGIRTKDTPQRMVDKEIGERHVDLIDLTGKQVIRLAQLINSVFDPLVMARTEILQAGAKFFGNGRFDRDFLFAKGNKGRTDAEIANSKELLVNLWKKGEINLL